jgi:hypothetical protein
MINTGIPTLTREGTKTFIYRYTQTNTETLDLWYAAVVVFDENALDLVEATSQDELERQVAKIIRWRKEIARERELAQLARWNGQKGN